MLLFRFISIKAAKIYSLYFINEALLQLPQNLKMNNERKK